MSQRRSGSRENRRLARISGRHSRRINRYNPNVPVYLAVHGGHFRRSAFALFPPGILRAIS